MPDVGQLAPSAIDFHWCLFYCFFEKAISEVFSTSTHLPSSDIFWTANIYYQQPRVKTRLLVSALKKTPSKLKQSVMSMTWYCCPNRNTMSFIQVHSPMQGQWNRSWPFSPDSLSSDYPAVRRVHRHSSISTVSQLIMAIAAQGKHYIARQGRSSAFYTVVIHFFSRKRMRGWRPKSFLCWTLKHRTF